MRHLKFLVCLLALSACTLNNGYETMNAILQKAEAIYQHPDGERYDTEQADTLQISPELNKAADFFVSKKDYKNAAKAYLFYGYAQKEENDKVSAMHSFKDAEHYGNIAGDSLTTARAQYNIAHILSDEMDFDESLAIAYNANKNFGNNYAELALLHNLMSISYIIQKKYDDAETHLKQALAYAEQGQSIKAKTKILNNYSVFYREQKKYRDAIDYLTLLKSIDTDSTLTLMFYHNMSTIYTYSDDYDSAAYYAQKALDLSKTIKVKPQTELSIYFFSYFIAKKQGKYQQALEYFEKNDMLKNKIQKEIENKNLYNIQRKYDYEALQNKMNRQIIQKQRIILVISLLLLLVSLIVIGLLLRQKKILKEDEKIRKELDQTKEELKNSIKPEVVEKELSRQLHLIITANRIAERADDFKKEWSPLVHKINNGKDNMFDAAVIAIERVYPNMHAIIKNKYPDLNETEAKVMLLSCSDLTNAEIGHILGLSVHSVNKSKTEIRKKICDKTE